MAHDSIHHSLRERFGLEAFRPWQEEAVKELLHGGGKVLLVAPTGGGKSLCYQLPAVWLNDAAGTGSGPGLVVSPLIALMEDQVRALQERNIPATYLASTLPREELERREKEIAEGAYQLVYVAPERFRTPRVLRLFQQVKPALIAIDEAHCISQWGHDFRPDYLRLGPVLEAFPEARVIACTATATPAVRDEIVERLGIGPVHVVLRGFARPNLHLSAREVEGRKDRRRAAMDAVSKALGPVATPRGAAIVYAGTRKHTEALAEEFALQGWRAASYHAGLPPARREQVNAAFFERDLDVVVATNAFGMGIDRPDIRIVVHTQVPGSIEAYYQEVGRGGRDGEPASGVLYFGTGDYGFRRRLLEYGMEDTEHSRALLQRQWQLFLDLMGYAEAGSCRHDFILRYFGDEQETLGGCGHCDVCEHLELHGVEDRTLSEEEALVVRKALSGVARLRQRAGLTALAACLRGDDTERVRRMDLHRLSTYGLLSAYPKPWIMALLRRLITARLVDVTASDFPVPYLTALGVETMKGSETVRILLPPTSKPKRRKKDPAPGLSGAEGKAYEQLRERRMELARDRKVPAYVVCSDKTLRHLVELMPRSLAELQDVHGMGPSRIQDYGEQLLAVLASD